MVYENRFIAIDTETGGLPSKSKQAFIDIALTEVAMVTVDCHKLQILEKFSWLIKPYDDNCEYNPKAAEVSGISKDLLIKSGLELTNVYENIKSVLVNNKLGKCKPVIVCQNKSFDIPFLSNLFQLFGDHFENYIDRVEDTLDWARLKFIEKPDFKLGSLAGYCGLTLVESHRALPDAVITAEIFISFVKSLRDLNVIAGESANKPAEFRKIFKF